MTAPTASNPPSPRTYVGFGFGAIQAGLFLYEAFRSGKFTRLVVAEVLPDVVKAVREAGGHFTVNIAHPDRVESAKVGPVEIYHPAEAADREKLIGALAEAAEIGTAVPSVDCYRSSGAGSLHKVLAAGLERKAETGGPRAVVYAAENHNRAAEILEGLVFPEMPAARHGAVHWRVRFLNTVIGKMSGLVGGDGALPPVTPGGSRAFLVEAFNRILISQVRFPDNAPFERGLSVFEEKPDLLPFEEAKLFGHNATHALAAYLAALAGV
jgi:mannitol-1-phosphate/altronate dehydrogenase